MVDLKIINGAVFLNSKLEEVNLAINNGKIVAIGKTGNTPQAEKVIDAEGKLVLPGTVDPHVHIRDPGRPDRETFATGTMAAAAGGVTTLIEQPISTPPPYSPEIIKNRIKVARDKSYIDFAFYGAAGADKLEEIKKMASTGIVAYKTFLHSPPPGREEEFVGLTMENDGYIIAGLKKIAQTGLICAVHAENNEIIQYNINKFKNKNKVDYIHHLKSRPPLTEIETVEKLLRFGKETGAKLEFVHISTADSMSLIKKAKREGQEVFLETCPHFLFCTEEDMLKLGPFAKTNPPLRKKYMVKELWKYVNDGSVDFIGSDHAPFLLEEKEKGYENIFSCPAGFPSIQFRLPLMLDAVNNGMLTLDRMVELLAENPARIFGLYPQKGVIKVGSDADLVIVNMDKVFTVKKNMMFSKARDIAKIYEGKKLKGKPIFTIVRGKVIMIDDSIIGEKGWGKLVVPL